MRETERLGTIASMNAWIYQNSIWHSHWPWWSLDQAIEPINFSHDAIEEFVKAVVQAREANETTLTFGDDPNALKFSANSVGLPMNRFDDSIANSPDLVRFLLIHSRIISDGLPMEDWPELFRSSEDHRGEWVGWADDSLSARISWSSQIHHELSMLPHDWRIQPDGGIFMHLNTAVEVNDATGWGIFIRDRPLDSALPSGMWRHPPLQFPFPPTAWQRARQLHHKRPDLRFPDRPVFRPNSIRYGSL